MAEGILFRDHGENQIEVVVAPERALMSLGVMANQEWRGFSVHGDIITFGTIPPKVQYRVVGYWDGALQLRKVT